MSLRFWFEESTSLVPKGLGNGEDLGDVGSGVWACPVGLTNDQAVAARLNRERTRLACHRPRRADGIVTPA